MSNFYSGSKIFQPVSDAFGLTVDQFNFIFCQLVACGFGFIFSRYLDTNRISSTSRHIIQLISGVSLTVFCFGSQIWHLLAQSISVYIMMNSMSTKSARYFILGFVLLFLSVAHLARMYYDYGGYTMDITGPLMIQTQKLSSLAFNLHDGQRIKKKEPLRREYHRKHALLKYPGLLEFFSYMFYFHGIMVGPFVFMADYLRFIEGRQEEILETEAEKEIYKKNKSSILAGWSEIRKYIQACLIYGFLTMFIQPRFEADYLKSPAFLNSNFMHQYIWLTIICFLIRQKYYFAWSIGSISNLFSGMGFSGFGEDKKPKYDIIKNFDFSKIEMGTSLKTIIDNWNTGTIAWLRECVYDRMPRSKGTMAVFICSAIWHGYYPGYYLCFLSLSLFTTSCRTARQHLRPFVLATGSTLAHRAYDVLTGAAGMLILNYCAIAFMMLDVKRTIYLWSKMSYIVHLGALAVFLAATAVGKLGHTHSQAKSTSSSAATGTATTGRADDADKLLHKSSGDNAVAPNSRIDDEKYD